MTGFGDFISDFNQIKDQIKCKLINAEMNEDYLADKPHTLLEDLAVVYNIDLGSADDNSHMYVVITDRQMEQYGLTTEELHKIAVDNIVDAGTEFKTMREVIIEMLFPDGISEEDPMMFMLPPEEEKPSMYVLSNKEKLNGAAALLDTKIMDDIAEKLGGDFVVLPSSIHETIILPIDEDTDREVLEAMVQDVNMGHVAPEERLSDHVYIYDSKEHELVLADKLEERQQQREDAEKEDKAAVHGGKSGKTDRDDKKIEKERVSVKEKLSEKKAEIDKNGADKEQPAPGKSKDTVLA